METAERIGGKIALLRKSKGYTQAELGGLLNISAQAVSKWERGEACPDFDTLCKMAQFFGVSIDYFQQDGGEIATTSAATASAGKAMLGVCKDCGKVVYAGEEGETSPVLVCKACVERKKALQAQREREQKQAKERQIAAQKAGAVKARNRGFIWGGIAAAIGLIIGIISLTSTPAEEILGAIFSMIILCGITFTFVSQLFWDGAVLDCVTRGGAIVGTPGIIFDFDLDGFIFLIAMKLLFAAIRFIVYIITLLFFVAIGFIISPFTFVPALLRVNKEGI